MDKYTTFSHFSGVLTSSPILKKIMEKTEALIKLNHTVLEKLEPPLKSHCRVANLRDGILILTTSSPAFKHLLRFREIELLSALRSEPSFIGLKSIQSRVNPESSSDLSPEAIQALFPSPSLSPQSAAMIQATASNITSTKLRLALLKLAKHAK